MEERPASAQDKKTAGLFRRLPAADVDLVTDIRTTLLVQSPRGGQVIVWLVISHSQPPTWVNRCVS